MKHPKMLNKELKVFKKIMPHLNTIFDVGARYDTDYIEISRGRSINYHLFEINPRFFKKLQKKVSLYSNEKIFLNNVGVGHKVDKVNYYLNSESVYNIFSNKFLSLFSKKLDILPLKKYIKENNISLIDFLKTDIELFDYFALLGLGGYLVNINFIQFEFGVGAAHNSKFIKEEDYLDLFQKKYNFFLIRDEVNPIFSSLPEDIDLISFEYKDTKHIGKIQETGIGFNVLAINKSFNISDINFIITEYNHNLFDLELNHFLKKKI